MELFVNNLKCKIPIVVLSFVSLVFTLIGCLSYFFYYDNNYSYDYDTYFYELTFRFPDIISLLYLIFKLAPVVLMLLYIMIFHKQYKAPILVAVTFGLIGLMPLLSILNDILFFGYYHFSVNSSIYLAITVSFALLTVNALKGLNKKIYAFIAVFLGILVSIISLLNSSNFIEYCVEERLIFYVLVQLSSNIGSIALYVTIFLFALNNRIPAIISLSSDKEKQIMEKMSPEQSLRLLKDKLELGMITEEEYQAQRTEIISKL